MTVRLQNQIGGTKQTKTGFSWTTMFFGFFVPLLRGDLKWFIVMLLSNMLVGAVTGPFVVVAWIAWAALYNKLYLKDLLDKGYQGITEQEHNIILNYTN